VKPPVLPNAGERPAYAPYRLRFAHRHVIRLCET
jgi:hypothetical protein